MFRDVLKRKNFWLLSAASLLDTRAHAAWDLASVRLLGDECVIRERRIDETKLMLSFFDFSAQTLLASPLVQNEFGRCGMSVNFQIPAGHRLRTLTHRVQLHAQKGSQTELAVSAVVQISGQRFAQYGRIPRSASFNGRLLLYKSFELTNLTECSSMEQRIEVNADWLLEVKTIADPQPASVDLSGADDGIDLWLEIQRC